MAAKAISPPCAVTVSVAGPQRVEVIAIPEVGLDDPPAADQAAVGRRLHAGAPRSFGSRARL